MLVLMSQVYNKIHLGKLMALSSQADSKIQQDNLLVLLSYRNLRKIFQGGKGFEKLNRMHNIQFFHQL